jgi:CHAT domain-containing protein
MQPVAVADLSEQVLHEVEQVMAGGGEQHSSGARLEQAAQRLGCLPSRAQEQLFFDLKKQADGWMRSDIQRCLVLCEAMVTLADAVQSPNLRAVALRARGNAYAIGLSDAGRGLEDYDAAGEIYASLGDEVQQAESVIGKIFALMSQSQYERAFAEGAWAQEVLERHAAWLPLARLTTNLALLQGRLGRDALALALLDKAKASYQHLGLQGEGYWPRVEINRSVVLRNLGRFVEAVQAAEAALAQYERLGETISAARARQSLAVTCYVMGRFNESLSLFEAARRDFLGDERTRNTLVLDLMISDCLLALRRYPEVIEKCRAARAFLVERGDRFGVGEAWRNEARAWAGLGKPEQALEALGEARRLFEEEGNPVATADADLLAAQLELSQGKAREALEKARGCAAVYAERGLPVWLARAETIACRACLALGDEAQAAERLAKLHDLIAEHNLPGLAYPGYQLSAELKRAQGDLPGALEAYEQAMQALERLAGTLMIEHRAGFIEDKTGLYENAVEICLELDSPERGLQLAERAKSRALVDLLAYRVNLGISARSSQDQPLVDELAGLHAERNQILRRWEAGEGFGQRGEEQPLLENEEAARLRLLDVEKRMTDAWHQLLVRNADYAREAALWQGDDAPSLPGLEPGNLLVEYFSLHGQFMAFVASQDKVQAVRLNISEADVQRLLQLLWLNLRTMGRAGEQQARLLSDNGRGILERLHRALITPLESWLEGAESLLIVPHRSLHYLPFHALFDGAHFLLEKYSISYLPGASLLRFCRAERRSNGRPVVFGHSYDGRLPYTLDEARRVAGNYATQSLLEEQATLGSFRELAPQAPILHLAAHGSFRADNPLFSGIALEDGWLTTLDIFNTRLQAELVTLSACQTGRSVVGGGDELLGLMRAFLAAGVASLVASLWAVDDHSTAELMVSFYRHLSAGDSRREALRLAQLELLASETLPGRYRHPYYWAPFYLVGNPDPFDLPRRSL